MARFGLVGPTYQSQSQVADAERCVNWYLEANEAPYGKSKASLYPSPGLKLFCDLTATEGNVRGLFTQNGRCFAGGTNFYEIFGDGSKNKIGALAASPNPVVMAATQTQILILDAGQLWLYTLASGTFVAVNMAQFSGPVSMIGATDGFFLALVANSQTLQVSNLLDGSTWSGLNVGQISVFPDNLVGMLVDHREVWLWGSKASTVYYDSGTAFFPFSPIPGVYLETGAASTYAQVKLNNSVFWIHLDDRGTAMAFKANGYAPQRVSNYSVEYIWSTYPTVADAIGYSFVDQGHAFWHLYFPSANASWRYDDATGQWHEPLSWTGLAYVAHRSRCHTFAFGKHLVGDTQSGKIYDMSINYGTDDGVNIRRRRVTPVVSNENIWLFHRQLQLDCEPGIATATLPGVVPPDVGHGLTTLYLPDQNNVVWAVQIDAHNDFVFQQVTQLAFNVVYLLDTVNANTVWKLGVDSTNPANPYITVTSVAFSTFGTIAFQNLKFVTQTSLQAYVTVDNHVLTKNILPGVRGPIVTMRFSDDNAKTWSQEHNASLGFPGKYKKRVLWRRLGRSRNRSYEITYSDPYPLRIIEGDLTAEPGFAPQERLGNQFGKGA